MVAFAAGLSFPESVAVGLGEGVAVRLAEGDGVSSATGDGVARDPARGPGLIGRTGSDN